VYHGAEGLKRIAAHAHKYAVIVAEKLKAAGYKLSSEYFFDTLEIQNVHAETIREKAEAKGINFFYPSESSVRISFDEVTTCEEAQAIMNIFDLKKECACDNFSKSLVLPRESEILTETVFHRYHSETEMMRYIKKLERRDISLTQSMIPLGSCTMKLNAAVEMLPLSWPEFYNMHPYAPAAQAEGYLQILKEVEHDLAVITGFDAVSLQPNSGAAGEYTGLMLIRAYHKAKGNEHRNVALIPTSAHGTNPASAVMAGMQIVLVSCDENGNINVNELREKAVQHKDNLACIMITYPSTHGVFESRIKEMVDIVHENGGLVFMDGANMNAQVGLTNPGFIGADVCHLNLHKTFAMPHGGGGPGVGPVAVAKHLTPFLPSHSVVKTGGEKGISAVSAAPYGNALSCLITHAYIKLLGAEGLTRTTSLAILNANYLSARLQPHYNTLFIGETKRVAHECIIDLRHFKKEYGVDATDVAKRLMDFGFHAPTLSFPVPETLMIEPTESESLAELERLVQALIYIKEECIAVKNGKFDAADNPLKMAPHTAVEVTADEWAHPYSRTQAAYPLAWVSENKFWPHVARVDNGYGDRNLVTMAT
jgi:glycine dehydrogenase